MPGKARRVASRQAQLNRRKKQQRAPRPAPAVATVPASGNEAAASENSLQAAPAPGASSPVQNAPSTAAPTLAARPVSQARARREQTLSTNYTVPEVRRILLFSSVIFAAIVVLGFVVP